MKRILALLLLSVFLIGCTNESQASRVLEQNGYTDISFTGYDWFACSEDDTYHTGFEATAANGKRVRGTVCAGTFFKGATIRFK